MTGQTEPRRARARPRRRSCRPTGAVAPARARPPTVRRRPVPAQPGPAAPTADGHPPRPPRARCWPAATGWAPGWVRTPPQGPSSGAPKTPCCAATSPPPCCAASARAPTPTTTAGAARAEEIIAKALRSGSFEHPGCARLLDVLAPGAPGLPDGVLGAAVAEWVPGPQPRRRRRGRHAQAPRRGPRPAAAGGRRGGRAPARPRAGLRPPPAGPAHPRRPPADGLRAAAPRADPGRRRPRSGRGALHAAHRAVAALAVRRRAGRADARPSGARTARRSRRRRSAPVCPSSWRRWSSARSARDPTPERVRTAAAVRSVVDEVVAEADRVVLFPPEHDGVPAGARRRLAAPRRRAQAARWTRARRRKLAVGLAGLGLCVLGVAGYIERAARRAVRRSDPAHRGRQQRGARAPPRRPRRRRAVRQRRSGDAAVKAVGAAVYDDAGDRDNAGRVSRVIDGDPGTGWKTFSYSSSSRRSSRASGS